MDHDASDRLRRMLGNCLPRRRAAGALAALVVGPTFAPEQPLARQARASETLLVRGEAELAEGAPLAWRVVRDVAEVGPAARFEERALGFAVAAGPFTSLLLTDEATGSAFRLAPGEAAFVREGTRQRRESLGEMPDSYLRIGLVAEAAANDAGGDRLLFPGPAFPAPAGPVTLSLHRLALAAGQSIGIPPGAGESDTLLLVEQGGLELEVGEGAARDLMRTVVGSDTAYAIRSVPAVATLYATRDATSVLIAGIA